MSAIGPGDWVECVDNGPRSVDGFDLPGCPELVLKALYRVAEVVPADQYDEAGLLLDEVVFEHGKLTCQNGRFYMTFGGYAISRFRPVYRPRADLIETLLQPVDGVEPRVDA